MPDKQMSEEQMVRLVRNALLVAGTEMGEQGDHWPVIKSTVHGIMKDWEDLKIERNVHAEIKAQISIALADLEKSLASCPDDLKPEMKKMMRELQEIYAAQFTDTDESKIIANDDEIPIHVKRAKAIVKTLEGQDD
jgi:hypothetical protein